MSHAELAAERSRAEVARSSRDLLPPHELSTSPSLVPHEASLHIERVTPDQFYEFRDAWTDLVARSDAQNVFMDPAMIAAGAHYQRNCVVLLAWDVSTGHRRLDGVLAASIGVPRESILSSRVLNAPPFEQQFNGSLILDRANADAALDAMLDAIAADARLPTIVAFDAMPLDGVTMQAMERVVAARGGTTRVFSSTERPVLRPGLEPKAYWEAAVSSSSRKKLRQHRRRLSEKGVLTSRVAVDPAAVRDAFEQFVALETNGWKGSQGTALACNTTDLAFARAAIGALADRGGASIYALELDGKPVSMQVVFRCGSTAFTWKTAYDEAFQDYSPGMLLLEDYTAAFLSDPSIALVDSCSYDASSFMSVWRERQPIASLWIDARRSGTSGFRLLAAIHHLYGRLRVLAKKARSKLGR